MRTKLDAELSAMIGDAGSNVLGLGVIVFKDGEEIYGGFFGRRHVNPDRPVTRDTRFRIASVLSNVNERLSTEELIKLALKELHR